MEQVRAAGSRRRAWGGWEQVCRQDLLPGATADPGLVADKGPIKRGQGGRSAAGVEEHDSSLSRPGNL